MSHPSASRSVARSFAATRLFLRKQLWIWPLVAAVILAGLGWWVRDAVENGTKEKLASDLQTILNADVAALHIWLDSQEATAQALADDDRVRKLIGQLVKQANQPDTTATAFLQSPILAELRAGLEPWLQTEDYAGFVVIDSNLKIVAAQEDVWVGKAMPDDHAHYMTPILAGKPTVTRPAKSLILLPAKDGQLKAGLPTMFVLAPVDGENKEVIAGLGLRIRPEDDFTRILSIARAGESGETYAFDETGLLISQSRFDEELKQIGLITDQEDSQSILNLEIRDPEVDMTRGQRPPKRRSEQKLTRMAADAVAGNDGVDVTGYRDYRGVPAVGAWTWLDEYGFGVATEVDLAEAFRPLYVLRMAFGVLFALLAASAVAIFVFSAIAARLGQQARKAALEAKQLGQYTLDEKIGAGGMGVVYRAHHGMLQRPTAVKLLDVEKTTDETIARFEREVRLTSRLNHPNTIAVYDYGRTPEGVFYYAMEYLDGITLEDLVGEFGPQPEGRVVQVLLQVCGSLNEAHGVGLIHRDIKPANIILNRRGGMCDVVKLLDFGLVKAVDTQRDAKLTKAGAMTGTPLYLSPEGVQAPERVDHRSDLYAVGAVGYFLVTGKSLFEGQSAVDICMHQVHTVPDLPSKRLGKTVSPDLEEALMRCLSKSPDDRPGSAEILAEQLKNCRSAAAWTRADATAWWEQYGSAPKKASTAEPTPDGVAGETIIHDSRSSDS
jgi:hypothetical protein